LNTNGQQQGDVWHGLDISNKQVHCLSPSISIFSHITYLNLSNNSLSDLPSTVFTHLTSLVHLDLSNNLFAHLPVQVGELQYLSELLLHGNKLVNLPWTVGRLVRLRNLTLDNNPIIWPPLQVIQKGTQFIVTYLRDRMPSPPAPPDRKMVSCAEPNPTNKRSPPPSEKISVFCYNILAEKYATPEGHVCTPSWALEWSYRKERILGELLKSNADILCLQEVEAKHYRDFFQVEMGRVGYTGVFRPKSRARTMEDWDQVDGCVIFYRNKTFEFVEEHFIEFQAMAMSKHKEFEGDHEALVRIMTRDNIALAVVLKCNGSPLIVVNTHIHWDPQYSDVKLIQVQFMMERLVALAGSGGPWEGAPLIICGDFNSMPGSGPYDLITTGSASATHPDLQEGYNYGNYSRSGFSHPFKLDSAYGYMGEPPFTNYTLDFVGTLDYIFFSNKLLKVVQILEPVEAQVVKSTRLPNPYYCSDHISVMAELQFL